MKRECLICNKEFDASYVEKTCSEACREIHRKNRRKKSDENVTVTRICKFCNNKFRAKRYKPKAFCNRSCASKYYIQNGTYDKWRMCRTGTGRRVTKEQIERQKNTMIKKYGVVCGYHLAKTRRISKQQRNLFELVKEIDNTAVIEKRIPGSNYFVDILLIDKRKIIEYNGDYWHCNPKKYSENYFNKKIKKFARDIWNTDLERRKILEQMNYSVLCIWESEFCKNREAIEQKIKEFLL